MEEIYSPVDGNIEEEARQEQKAELKDIENVNSHSSQLTELLHNYVSTYKERVSQNKELRDNFYLIVISILVFLSIAFPLLIIWLLWSGKIVDVSAAAGLISASAAIITSVIVLPRTIAEYLFSTEEDSKNADIVKEIIKSDLEIRNKLKQNTSDVFDSKKN